MSSELMPAVLVSEEAKRGEWNELAIRMVPKPSPGEGQVLVRVEACSVNRADLLQRRGLYPPPPGASHVLGLDFAGVVERSGTRVGGWKEGDRVFGIVAGGGYGRFVAVPAGSLVPVPENIGFVEAAAISEVFYTAYYNMFMVAVMKAGEKLLVHGAGSGVGTAAIQLAKAFEIEVIATAGSAGKLSRALKLGAVHGINYREEDFAERVKKITAGEGVDVILDWIGASYLSKHLDILKTRGRLVIIGLMGGSSAEIDLARVVLNRIRIFGSVLRSQSPEEKAAITKSFVREILPLLATGKVGPVIDRVFPIDRVEDAHRYMKQGGHFGKIVLSWADFES